MQISSTVDACEKSADPGRVQRVRGALDDDEAVRLAEMFKMLGDPTRARILTALLEAGELCVCEIAEAVDAPESTVSHALRLLRTAEVVSARRDGRTVNYSLHDAHVRLVLDLSLEHLRHGALR